MAFAAREAAETEGTAPDASALRRGVQAGVLGEAPVTYWVAEAPDDAPGKRARAAYLSRMSEQSTWRSRLDAEPEYHEITERGASLSV